MTAKIVLHQTVPRLLCGDEKGLFLQEKQGVTPLFSHPVRDFDSECCPKQGIVAAIVTPQNDLLAVQFAGGALHMQHLTRAGACTLSCPTVLFVNQTLHFYFTVAGSAAYRLVCYRKTAASWEACTLYQSPHTLTVVGCHKRENTVYFQLAHPSGQFLLYSASPTACRQIDKQSAPFSFVQAQGDHLIYQCGQTVYINHAPFLNGTMPCPTGENHLIYMAKNGLRAISLPDRRPLQPPFPGRRWQLYAVSTERFKGFCIAPHFTTVNPPSYRGTASGPLSPDISNPNNTPRSPLR